MGQLAGALENFVGLQMLPAVTFFCGAAVIQLGRLVAKFIDDNTSSNDFGGEGKDTIRGCVRHWESNVVC